MPTEVVVATLVKTRLSEAGFRQLMVEQLQVNDRILRNRLADADGGANVVTAVLNVDDFLNYLMLRFPTAVDAPAAGGETTEGVATAAPMESAVDVPVNAAVNPADSSTSNSAIDTAKMSEGEFMNYMFDQLESGAVEARVHFPADHWDDDEEIGEDFSRFPFYY
jgi:hypothetical protein